MHQRTNISISNSHLTAEEECQLKGLIGYRLGWRSPNRGSANRRGILGHEIIAAVLKGDLSAKHLACACPDDWHALSPIIDKQHERNEWGGIEETYDEAEHACYGVERALDAFSDVEFLSDDEGPCIERKYTAPIDDLIDLHSITGAAADTLRKHCVNGQAKVDALIKSASGVELGDWKIRRTAIPFYAMDMLRVPDPQADWYWAVLHCAGFELTGVAQVLVHAEKPAKPLTLDEIPVNKNGLPSRRHTYTTVDVYTQALQRARAQHPKLFTPATIKTYQEHLAKLAEQEAAHGDDEAAKVRILPRRIDRNLAIKLNRERLLNLAENLAKKSAHRSLKVYNSSPCTKPPAFTRDDDQYRWPCMVQEACHLAMMSDVPSAIQALSTQGERRYINVYEKKEKST